MHEEHRLLRKFFKFVLEDNYLEDVIKFADFTPQERAELDKLDQEIAEHGYGE